MRINQTFTSVAVPLLLNSIAHTAETQGRSRSARYDLTRRNICHTPEPWFVSVVVKSKPIQTKTRKEKGMSARADFKTQSPELLKEYVEFNNLVKEGEIEEKARDLVAISAPQLNGCAFCLNTSCLRNTSALLPNRFSCRSLRTTSLNEGSPN